MSTKQAYKNECYTALIGRILDINAPDGTTLDRDAIAAQCDIPRHMVDLGILALARNGAMYQKGVMYTVLPMLASVTGEELTEWVTTYQREKAQRNKPTDQLPVEFPQATPAPQYGYWQGSGFSWYDDKQTAVTSATTQALEHGTTIDLVQRIGEVKVQPTVTFF